MTTPKVNGAVNAQTRVVIDYAPDPNAPSRGVFADLFARLHGFLVPVVAGGDTDRGAQFHGYGPELQGFKGATNPASNAVLYRNGGYPELGNAATGGVVTDPVRRMYADRLRRRA